MTIGFDSSPVPTRIDQVFHASRQDFLLVVSALLVHITTSLGFWIFAFAVIKLGRDIGRKVSSAGYVPPEIDHNEIPPRTYFVLLEPDRYGWMNWYFRKRLKQYFTWSFYFVNIIFCPVHKMPDRYGQRRLQLIHEFSHCGRGELALFIMAMFAAFSMIRTSVTIWIHHSGTPVHLPYFNILLTAFGAYIFCSAARIMRRREFIADYLAYQKMGQPYLAYLKFHRDGDLINISTSAEKHWLTSIIAKVRWHPTWKERVEFIEEENRLPKGDVVGLLFNAFLSALVASQVAQLMLLPRQTVLTWFFRESPSTFMQPFGFAMHFVVMAWLCWLMARSTKALRATTWTFLIVAYAVGAALAQFSLMYVERLFFASNTYNHWHFIQPWGTAASWVLTSIILFSIPFFRRAPMWVFTIYSGIGYFWGFSNFVLLLTLYEEGRLPRDDPYFIAIFPSAIVVLTILLSLVLAGPIELFRRALMWSSRRFRARFHP
ncbi:hypothetical protein [Phaeobacter inhibens]|uniref:hypothetical protein n=1 Tax=Phaeobacter inhibens TaxID=221822 RepID=UPI00295EF5D4|nr:hypothetical protein [Phaeobacter inhibens]